MRFYLIILFFFFITACSSGPSLKSPDEGVKIDLQMLTTGGNNFEDYIHSLEIYAFTYSSDGYIFYKLLAQLTPDDIRQLENVSNRKNSKLFSITLPIGDYELYFLGNIPSEDIDVPRPGISKPADIFIRCADGIPDSPYFLGISKVRIVDNSIVPARVTLNRIVSKLVTVLYGVPEVIDTIGISLGNISSRMDITGTMATDTVTAKVFFPVKTGLSDTVVFEMLTFPTVVGVSPMSLIFHSSSGEVGVRQLPDVSLLPDKYIRVTGKIVNNPVGGVDASVETGLFIYGIAPSDSIYNTLYNLEKK